MNIDSSFYLPHPNLALLRKELAWAEEEARKGVDDPTREWLQGAWYTPAAVRSWDADANSCGSAYCLFGHTCFDMGDDVRALYLEGNFLLTGKHHLGLTLQEAEQLSHPANSITDLRRIAEQIAARVGETL